MHSVFRREGAGWEGEEGERNMVTGGKLKEICNKRIKKKNKENFFVCHFEVSRRGYFLTSSV